MFANHSIHYVNMAAFKYNIFSILYAMTQCIICYIITIYIISIVLKTLLARGEHHKIKNMSPIFRNIISTRRS